MRYLFSALTAMGLLGLTVGCHHTAGMCDCDQPESPCCYYNLGGHVMPAAPVVPGAPAPAMNMLPDAKEKIVAPKETTTPSREKPKDKDL